MRADHVVLDLRTGAFTCRHCGEAYRMELPCSIRVFVAASQAFEKQHQHCPKPAEVSSR